MRARGFRGGSRATFIPLLPLDSSPTQGKALSPHFCSLDGESEVLSREGRDPRPHGFQALGPLRMFWDRGGQGGKERNPGISKSPQTTPEEGGGARSCIGHQGSLPAQERVLRRPGLVRRGMGRGSGPRAIQSLGVGRALWRVLPGKICVGPSLYGRTRGMAWRWIETEGGAGGGLPA